MLSIEITLLIAALLLFVCVAASKVSDKLGVPVLLLFLSIGMLAGSEGFGGIYFNDPWIAKSLGTVALVFILFSGGFETHWADVRSIIKPGLILSTIGVLITAVSVGWFSTYALGFSLIEGLLLGAIVSSTDAAAVFDILRSKSVSLRNKLQPLLEFESGSNDPMAVFLTVGIITLLKNPSLSPTSLIPAFVLDMGIGILAAFVFSHLIIFMINRLKLSYDGLYPVLLLSLVFLTYAATTTLHGNGFLAVYLVGIIIGNANLIHKKTLKSFFEGIAWLMQILMFLALGLLVFPSKVIPVIGIGLSISLFLIFAARPLSVFLCLSFTKMNWREKTFVSWVGLRGAVPIILATFPLLAGTPKADIIFNVVFFIVLTSVLFQGTTIPLMSKLLDVDAPIKNKKVYPIEFEHSGDIDADLEDVIVPYNSAVVGQHIFEVKLPQGCLVVLISRDDKFFIPNGLTIINGGDVFLVLSNKEDLQKLQEIFSRQDQSL
jgi:cell volume regulation protein A